jgi:hypothetical protein
MDKQRKSAAELAGMVTEMIGVGGLEVVVNTDPLDGWRPKVVKASRTVERFQHLAEKNGRAVARQIRSGRLGELLGGSWTGGWAAQRRSANA